jgi:hypothetical protein
MKIEVQVVVAFTVTAALTAAASYPAIARAASNGGAFRSYSGHQCKGPAIAYTLNGAQVGVVGAATSVQGLTTAFCPLVNDTGLPLNVTPSPTVHLNGTFSFAGPADQIHVEPCSLNAMTGNDMSCGRPTSASAGTQQLVILNTDIWTGRADNDGYFLYVNVDGNGVGTSDNTAELWSYDSEF